MNDLTLSQAGRRTAYFAVLSAYAILQLSRPKNEDKAAEFLSILMKSEKEARMRAK